MRRSIDQKEVRGKNANGGVMVHFQVNGKRERKKNDDRQCGVGFSLPGCAFVRVRGGGIKA